MIDMTKRKWENCEFPQLYDIADPEKLAPMLEHYLAPSSISDEIQVDECAVDDLYYKPGVNCRMVLTTKLHRQNNSESDRQIFFGKLFHSQSAAKKALDSINHEDLTQPKFGPAVTYVPEWEMVLWAYPNDPNLPGLPLMFDADKILALIRAAPEKFGLNHPPAALRATMTKYVPGKRCGFIYRPEAPSNSQEANGSQAIYGKAYSKGKGEEAYWIMKQIWESAACQKGAFKIPRPYWYDPKTEIIWQEALTGQPFGDLKNLPDLPEMVKEIGVCLAAFHGTPLQLPQEMTLNFKVDRVREVVATISEIFPDYAQACSVMGQKLSDAAARLGPGPLTPVHASFKFSHIFATARGIAFIDFDGANMGDPGYDLGRFIAHVYSMAAGEKIAPELAEQTVMNFCASYNRAALSPVPQERIDWFAASHLMRSEVYKSVKRMNPRLMSKLLEIADALRPA
ncbi:aminoglycoside phosphotransferase family protein [candidate division KSB1 bacterium]|nr:aminoglycoside phosphotransferase family protein [candidate division KSB1 bacterium]